MEKYLYETHLHTYPVSKCARCTVRENLEFYKSLGYAGVFITNHFIDGNINYDKTLPYAEKVEFYFSDYEEGLRIGKELGISVFLGVESSYKGTDFLILGLDKEWFLAHPEIEGMKRSDLLTFLAKEGAFIVQAHPYREASYINHIRLFPRFVHGTEIYNGNCNDFENSMAQNYASAYDLIPLAGSDNHKGANHKKLCGIGCNSPIIDEADFIKKAKNRELEPFCRVLEE